ncbi:hypothetical protein Tco_1429205 [Tanacetum coccineum]
MNPSAKKAPMKSKPFKECKYCGFNDHQNTTLGVKAAFVNGLKHNLISINQLCDANYKVLFTKTKRTIFNQNDEVVLISSRRKSRVRNSETASAHECLYVNFLSEMEPKKLIEALEEEGWIIVRQEELNQFEKNKV